MLDYENQSISPDFIPYNPLPSISPDGSDLQKIDSRNIQFIEKMKVSNLEFIPVDSDKIVATINASTEGISIDANKISISGSTSFSSGYDPSQKVDEIGGNYTSSTSGARVLIFPDTITGIQVKDDASNDVFKCLVGGTNVGDVILGDYNSGKYVMWDKSETTLKLGSNAYVDSRLASTISSAINASGNFVNNVINTNLDTSTKQILGSFTFGTSGAIKMATDDNNGLWLSPNGIFGKKSGATTFSIDTQGNATFAGNLNAASGTLGAITAGTLSGVTIKYGKTSFDDYTNAGIWMGFDSGLYKFHLGNPDTYFVYNGSSNSAFYFVGTVAIDTASGLDNNSQTVFRIPRSTSVVNGFKVFTDYHSQSSYFSENYNLCSLNTWEADGNISDSVILKALLSTGGTAGEATQTIDKGRIKLYVPSGSGTKNSYIQSKQTMTPADRNIMCEFVIESGGYLRFINKIGFYKDANNYCYLYTNPNVSSTKHYLATNTNGLGEHLLDLGEMGRVSGRWRIEITSSGSGKITYRIYYNNWNCVSTYWGGEYSVSSGASPETAMNFRAEIAKDIDDSYTCYLRNIKFGDMTTF